jgi:hypothetical protein
MSPATGSCLVSFFKMSVTHSFIWNFQTDRATCWLNELMELVNDWCVIREWLHAFVPWLVYYKTGLCISLSSWIHRLASSTNIVQNSSIASSVVHVIKKLVQWQMMQWGWTFLILLVYCIGLSCDWMWYCPEMLTVSMVSEHVTKSRPPTSTMHSCFEMVWFVAAQFRWCLDNWITSCFEPVSSAILFQWLIV